MKRILLPAVLGVVIAGLLVYIGFLLWENKFILNQPLITEQSDISAHTVIKQVLPIGEYASLAYHYTSVVKNVNARDIRGWTIPFTTRRYIFTYDGTMKLGIDGTKIRIDVPANGADTGIAAGTSLPVIRIAFPEIVILSHEIMDDSIEVFEQSQTIFNEIKLADAFNVTAERKREMEEKVMASDVIKEAQVSVEQQFGTLLRNLPGIRDNYELEFVWQDTNPEESPGGPAGLRQEPAVSSGG
jgi:hypothetical protein